MKSTNYWGAGRLSKGSLFRMSIIPKVHYFENSSFRRFVIPKFRYSEGSLFRKFVISKVRYSELSLFQSFVLSKRRYSEGSLFRKFVIPKLYITLIHTRQRWRCGRMTGSGAKDLGFESNLRFGVSL